MHSLLFWHNWPNASRFLFWLTLSFFLLTVGLFGYSQWMGKNVALGWELITDLRTTRTVVDTFEKGFFQFAVDIPNQYLFQSYVGAPFAIQPSLYYLVVLSIGLMLITGSVAITYVKGIWYYPALLLLGGFIYLLNLDVLSVFGWRNMYWPIATFLSFGIAIHFFQSFYPDKSLGYRCIALLALTLSFFATTLCFSQIENPALHLVAYGWHAPFVMALVYIFLIASEIYQVFLFLATDSRHAKPSSSLINFLLMSFVYLGNVVLTFLKNRHSIDWQLFYLEAPLLLVVCAILGIWGFRKKAPSYSFIVDFSPSLALWHMVIAFNCFVCYAFVNLTGNDSLQEVFEDGIIFSQITIGIMFIIFVVINFWGYMTQHLPIHMVAYQPRYMPFGFVRIIGAIGVFSIVMYNSQYQYRQALCGYYTSIADIYAWENNDLLTNEYLLSALSEEQGGNKANYALAMLLHKQKKDDILVKSYLKQASIKNPTPQAYATLGYLLLSDDDILRAFEILREGKTRFPESSEILNNLAIAFSKTDIHDSTLYYFHLARKYTKGKQVAASNELAFALQNGITPSLEPLKETDMAYHANFLAVLNKKNLAYNQAFDVSLLSDTALSSEELAYVVNYASHHLKDTTYFKSAWLDTLAKKPANEGHYESLMLAKAYTHYYGGAVAEGIATLDQLQATVANPAQYLNTLSNWFMQQDAPKVATDFLIRVKESGEANADFGLAISTSFYLPDNKALPYWKAPVLFSDSVFRKIATQLFSNSSNVYKLGILPQLYSSTELINEFRRLPSSRDKLKASTRLMNELNQKGESQMAIDLYKQSDNSSLATNWEYVRALKRAGLLEEVSAMVPKVSTPEIAYVQAWILEKSNPGEAEKMYKKAFKIAPLYEEGILDALNFFQGKQNQEETYQVLLQSVLLNPYSPTLQKAYARQSVKMHLFSFADFAVEKVKDLLPKSEYEAFALEIQKSKEQINNNVDWK